jgi:hypothetical protein
VSCAMATEALPNVSRMAAAVAAIARFIFYLLSIVGSRIPGPRGPKRRSDTWAE